MNYPHIYHKVFNEPWLIEPSAHHAIAATLLGHQRGRIDALPLTPVVSEGFMGDPDGQEEPECFQRIGSIARIRISGIIGKHMSTLETMCGGCDLATVQAALAAAIADPAISTILLDINSPGGTVIGVPEFAAMVRRARETKQVAAFTEGLMCSAAMWIGSQADTIFATSSARVGSIGVYRTWLDDSAALAQEGIRRELFEAGIHKAAGLRPITEEERAIFQAEVDQIHAQFKAEVTTQRPGVPDAAMQGLTYWGAAAQENKLVDAFVDCLEDLIAVLQ